jgi:polysaccharide pyruvyl transferase WcaK-like protein
MGISSIGISLRPGLGPANLERLSRALTTLAKEEFKLVFLPFHTGQDLPVLKMLTTKESFPISLVEAHQPSDLWEAMKHLDLVIGMRLHSLVFALLLGLPFCALSYDPKVENFIRQVEEAGSHPIQWWQASEALDERVFVRQITELYAQRAAHRKCLQSARETLQSVAQETLNRAIDHIIRNLGER